MAEFGDELDGALDLVEVATRDGVEHGEFDIFFPGASHEGAQVFRKAGTAIGQTGFEIGPGNVELRIPAHDVHHFAAVDAMGLAELADLVGERNFHRMERVAGELDRLGGANRNTHLRRVYAAVQVRE